MQIIILISVLLIALVYLHIKQSSMIFQRDIKISINLLIAALILVVGARLFTLLITMVVFSTNQHRMARSASTGALAFWPLLYDFFIWILVVIAYAKFFSGVRKVAYFKKTESVDPLLRAKVRKILLKFIEEKWQTEEYGIFLQVRHEDPVVESIRSECSRMYFVDGQKSEEQIEKLKGFAEKLKE